MGWDAERWEPEAYVEGREYARQLGKRKAANVTNPYDRASDVFRERMRAEAWLRGFAFERARMPARDERALELAKAKARE
jgi:hypothetical protein